MTRLAPFMFLAVLGVAGCASPSTPDLDEPRSVATTSARPRATPAATEASVDPLLETVLTDVVTGDTLTLAGLATDAPVIVETMAIWCSNCRAQQQEVAEAHALAEFHSVSIDVDPNERPEDLARYAEREGFDWAFVVADAPLAVELRDRFSPAVLNPPSMPKLIIYRDRTIQALEFGRLLSAEELARIVAE